MGLTAKTLAGHVDQRLGVCQHPVIYFRPAIDFFIASPVVSVAHHKMFNTNLMTNKMNGNKSWNVKHFNPEHLGPHRRVFTPVYPVQSHFGLSPAHRHFTRTAHETNTCKLLRYDSQ